MDRKTAPRNTNTLHWRVSTLGTFLFLALIFQNCTYSKLFKQKQHAPVDNAIELTWCTNTTAADYPVISSTFKGISFRIKAVKDTRQNTSFICDTLKNRPALDTVVSVTTLSDIEMWCRNGMYNALDSFGIARSEKTDAISIEAEILTLSAKESETFSGEAGLQITVKKHALLLWEGIVKGQSDLQLYIKPSPNCSSVLSDALMSAINNLFGDQCFIDAIEKSKAR